jgi:O-acetyl-ADP-ribose deacetylase (regulator of RNase III)
MLHKTNAPKPAGQDIYQTTLGGGHYLTLRRADITEEAVDAIVNAANSALMHGGGVAGAIVRKGGVMIQAESLRVAPVATGQAAITGAGKLPSKFVIHAVGPVWNSRFDKDETLAQKADSELASAVTASLEIAREKELASIALPPISSGIFGYPLERNTRVIVQALADWSNAHTGDSPQDIRVLVYGGPDSDIKFRLDLYVAELTARFGGSTLAGTQTA